MKAYQTVGSGAKRYSYDSTVYHRQSPENRRANEPTNTIDLPSEFK